MSSSPSLSRHRKGCFFLINSNVDSKSSLSPLAFALSLSFWLKYPTPTGAPWSESFLTYWLFLLVSSFSRTSQLMAYGRLGLEVFCKLWVTALFLSSVSGRFIVEKSSVRVLRPAHIRGTHEGAIANFGVPKYGGMLRGVVLYPEKGSTGCISFDEIHFKSRSGRPVILLLDRGDCYFALKAWNAQNAGAAAVLIADNIDEPLITMDTPDESRDEGFVEKIVIPSALINREFGEALKIAVNGSEEVVVRLDWRSLCHILMRGKQCLSQCINHGRYCAPDPEQDFSIGYEGKDVVLENLRQLLCSQSFNENYNRSWVWWDYVTDFHVRCSMKEKKYSKECAEDVIKSLGIPLHEVKECMGDPEADVDNLVLKKEQELQVGHGTRGTLERMAVLKAICAGFKESTEPSLCLNGDIETNECLERNGGCWQNLGLNVTACKDTFRGRICECPTVQGIQYKGDGYVFCKDKNVSRFGWLLSLLVLSCVVGAGIAGYIFYKYRLRSYMDSEIMAIMSQYMPLDNHQIEAQPLRQDSML
ncbi:hypothetical protein HPP92_016698 [Vanilla planifolia]|uniref:PA domain-containing protein n=1 Tax=Vanilla planifolia TaxID=51239 RepID=A0A835QJT9_VANPL|nr:hypothetical protein HPP92_016698 [Vanilla planifolia]